MSIFLPSSIPLRLPFAHYRNFNFTKPIKITNPSSELTDYQIKVELNTNNFPFSKCRDDGCDLRFLSDNRNPLDFWTESWSSTAATIWIKVDEISSYSEKIVWLLYGNPSASSASNIDNTFIFADDFVGSNGDSPDASKWEKRNTPTIQGNKLQCVDDEYVVSVNAYDIRGKYLEIKFKMPSGEDRQKSMIGDIKDTGNVNPATVVGMDGYALDRYDNRLMIRPIVNGGQGNPSEESTYFNGYAQTSWHHFGFQVNPSSPYSSLFRVKKTTWYNYYTEDWHDTNYNMYIYIGIRGTSLSVTSEYEWVFFRKYASPEPKVVIL